MEIELKQQLTNDARSDLNGHITFLSDLISRMATSPRRMIGVPNPPPEGTLLFPCLFLFFEQHAKLLFRKIYTVPGPDQNFANIPSVRIQV